MVVAALLLALSGCNPALAAHVYKPSRLTVLARCVTVTGTLVDADHGLHTDGMRHEADGDAHGWLRLDPSEDSLLDAGNRRDEHGNLVIEIVCRYPVHQIDAKEACAGYKSAVAMPPIGSRVAVTGVLVRDSNHGQWNEVHPVSSIKVIR